MNWHERMNAVVGYIETHLTEDIDMNKLARMTGQSQVNFQRTFSIVTDMSVHEYIRRRRLTQAAFQLANSREQVVDIAAAFRYESPEAFARAFKEIHGVSPSAARKKGTPLKTFPRITFQLILKGAVAMDYRIETKEAFDVYGIEKIFTMKGGKNLTDIPAFWTECRDDGRLGKLLQSAHGISGVHAVCDYREMEGDSFPYMLFAFKTPESDTDGYTQVRVPAATWAVFRTENHTLEQTPNAIQGLIKRVYTDWLPTAGYNKVDGYELELYFDAGFGMCYSETWIMVTPK
jgi:AraC family transcriptional regulator